MARITLSSYSFRVLILKMGILFFFLALIFKLYQLQIVDHNRFVALAEKQHWIGREIPAKRGQILTSDGFALATNVPAYLIYGVPREIKERHETARIMVETLGYESKLGLEDQADLEKIEEEKKSILKDMEEMLSQEELLYVPIANKQSEEIKIKLEGNNLPGIYFEQDYKRYYPEDKLASQVLGFVGKNDRGEDQGYYGIEGYFNGELKGIVGRVALEKDALGRPIPMGEYVPVGKDDGQDIVLTINRELQYMVENKLKAGVEKYGAEDGNVTIIDPKTGKVLAMASYPSYKPADWQSWTKDYSDKKEEELTDEEKQKKKYGVKVFSNLPVAQVYEPGSVFKPVTVSIALNKEKINKETLIESAPFPILEFTIRTWNDKYYGPSTPGEILQHSDNTGMARISEMIGLDDFYSGLDQYGFLEKTGIELEDEDSGWINLRDEWMKVDLATAAFGQGISVTPIQMLQAYTAFTNDGVMKQPYIVEEIRSGEVSQSLTPKAGIPVISEQTADDVVDLLVSVVEKGEFKFAVLKGYKIAGKTGTAQIAVNGVYDTAQTNCTFIGFAPAADPKFLMLVKLTRPTASTYSAETAVPLWMDIAKDLFVYFCIAPE